MPSAFRSEEKASATLAVNSIKGGDKGLQEIQ
jgi:hypothetical protein